MHTDAMAPNKKWDQDAASMLSMPVNGESEAYELHGGI